MKITVLMPTYNDETTIAESIQSLLQQDYKNWELLIMDDGSTDQTKVVISKIIKENPSFSIQYFLQTNQDQLAALDNLKEYITGEIVFILHSDDLLPNSKTFGLYIEFISLNPNHDAYYGDLLIIDDGSNLTGEIVSPSQMKKTKHVLSRTYLWLGRNSYADYSFFRVNTFMTRVTENYLRRNIPYWFSVNQDEITNIIKVNHPMAYYRIHQENYINSTIGLETVLSGNLRVFTSLMNNRYIPFFEYQYTIFRVLNKLKVARFFIPICFNKRERNMSKLTNFVVCKRLGKKALNNVYYKSILGFYSNNLIVNRKIELGDWVNRQPNLLGRDAKRFFINLEAGKINEEMLNFMNEVETGFDCVLTNEGNLCNVELLLDFFCISEFVRIELNDEKRLEL